MKRITPPIFVCVMITLLNTCAFNNYSHSQTIVIDSTFTVDAVLHPFGPNDTLYSLKISGNVQLNSDTSLVRIIVGNEDSLEYMVFETYPLISDDYSFSFTDNSDETTYLSGFLPEYLKIYLVNSSIFIDSIADREVFQENLDSLQISSKLWIENQKVQIMENKIEEFDMYWFCAVDSIYFMYYNKSKRYGKRYNLKGWEYYYGGIYESVGNVNNRYRDNSSLLPEFDWRNRHDADIPNTPYFDGDTDIYYYNCNGIYEEITEKGNGWMTSVKDQDPCREASCPGCCYIFGVLGAIEAVTNLFYNYHYDLDLSEQQGLDCDNWANGCEGGWPNRISNIAEIYGFVNEDCYSWIDEEMTCRNPDYCNGPDPLYQIKIYNWETVDRTSVFDIKEALINHGPLQACVYLYGPGGQQSLHSMVLCGYYNVQEGDVLYNNSFNDSIIIENGDNIIGSLTWRFKNSYSPHKDILGYKEMAHNSNLFVNSPLYGGDQIFYYEVPVTDLYNYDLEHHCLDEDNDGYYNWGLCNYEDKTLCGCDNSNMGEEDSHDNHNRIGPYDDNYYGK